MVDLKILGPPELKGGASGTADSVLTHSKHVALLAFLASYPPNSYTRRDRLAGLLWPEQTDDRARASLRQALYTLRHTLGTDVFCSRGSRDVRLNPHAMRVDLREFRAAVKSGDLALAANLYRGPLMDGFAMKGTVDFDQWIEQERADLRRRYIEVLEQLVEGALATGSLKDAKGWANRLLALGTYDSRSALLYMRALAAAGDVTGALAHAQLHTKRLRDDLGVDPPDEIESFVIGHRRRPTSQSESATGSVAPAVDAGSTAHSTGESSLESNAQRARIFFPFSISSHTLRNLGFGVVLLSAVFAVVFMADSRRRQSDAPVRLTMQTTGVERLSTHADPVRFGDRIAITPNGKHVVYVGGDGGARKLFLRDLESLETKAIPGTEGGYGPFISPDGDWVAFATTDMGPSSVLRKVRLPDGPVRSLITLPSTRMSGGTWTAHDEIVVAGRGGLYRISADGNDLDTVVVVEENGSWFGWPKALPGGKVVLVAERGGARGPRVRAVQLETGQGRDLGAGLGAQFISTGHLVVAAENGSLSAISFNPNSLTTMGAPVLVLDSLHAGPRGWLDWAASATGTLVYAPVGGATERMVIVDREGRETPMARERTEFLNPRFAHDGRRVAVSRLEDRRRGTNIALNLWTYQIGEAPLRLTRLNGHTQYAAWSADDHRVLFFNEVPGQHPAGYETSADGRTPPKPIIAGVDEPLWPTDWSRDGLNALGFVMRSSLVFEEDGAPASNQRIQDLALVDIASGDVRAVSKPGAQYGGRFSPNGEYVAYCSSETGRIEVWVRSVVDWETREWQISREGGTEPVWAADGSELFFWHGTRLMSVAVETGEQFAAREPLVVLERAYKRYTFGSNYDVHPEGDRFVMIDQDRSEIVVVLNWFEEIRAKAADP